MGWPFRGAPFALRRPPATAGGASATGEARASGLPAALPARPLGVEVDYFLPSTAPRFELPRELADRLPGACFRRAPESIGERALHRIDRLAQSMGHGWATVLFVQSLVHRIRRDPMSPCFPGILTGA